MQHIFYNCWTYVFLLENISQLIFDISTKESTTAFLISDGLASKAFVNAGIKVGTIWVSISLLMLCISLFWNPIAALVISVFLSNSLMCCFRVENSSTALDCFTILLNIASIIREVFPLAFSSNPTTSLSPSAKSLVKLCVHFWSGRNSFAFVAYACYQPFNLFEPSNWWVYVEKWNFGWNLPEVKWILQIASSVGHWVFRWSCTQI